MRHLLLVVICLSLGATSLYAETSGGGGGPFVEYHSGDFSAFDPQLTGVPVVIGGMGLGWLSKNFRLGGGGAAGMSWNGSPNLQFGMGYGGVIGEYLIAHWLSARMLIGGGGYSISKLLSQSDTTQTVQKIASGAFILFEPSMVVRFKLSNTLEMDGTMSYFLPNEGRLHSMTLGVNLLVGKI